jgi:phytoene dehydrogenase-like protein
MFWIHMQTDTPDWIVLGAGMAGLSAACLLVAKGQKVILLERNWIPGGCSTSYPRKHIWFDTGATTLVGLEHPLPLGYLARETGIQFQAKTLDIPMQVHLKNGASLTRYPDMARWIPEVERVFGKEGEHQKFWNESLNIAEKVWRASSRYLHFPPAKFGDWLALAAAFQPRDLSLIPKAFQSTADFIRRYGLDVHPEFMAFANEQLLITAQNHAHDTNVLFGATALTYPMVPNYYVNGGMRGVTDTLVNYFTAKGGLIMLRTAAEKIEKKKGFWEVHTPSTCFKAKGLISAIPINNLAHMLPQDMDAFTDFRTEDELFSAFQLSFVFTPHRTFPALHHQIHLETPLLGTGSASIFLSLSDPEDPLRCPAGQQVASVTTHISHPQKELTVDKTAIAEAVFKILINHGFLLETPSFWHASTQKAWEKWTGRSAGFVGGYPQRMAIPPWKMNSAQGPISGLWLAGDSVYPGQGIPGAALSGIIAAKRALAAQKFPLLF